MEGDYLETYREYVSRTIVPKLYNEWAAIASVATILAQQVWVTRGYYKVYPNLYVMLIGDPGSGKGTVSAILQGVLEDASYKRFAPDRTTKEKFLVDLEEGFDNDTSHIGSSPSSGNDNFFSADTVLTDFDKEHTANAVSDVFILAEELSDFFGTDNLDFVSMLTKLWSYKGTYRQRIKTGRSVAIPNPCINMYAGTTHDSFQLTFPSRLLGTGFLARFILVYGAVSAESEIAFPESPDIVQRHKLSHQLVSIKDAIVGEIPFTEEVKMVFASVLQNYKGPDDIRFKFYKTRRFVQLIKLAICFSAARMDKNILKEDIIKANTLLFATEQDMGKALGEFGKSKNSEVSNKIMQALYSTTRPLTPVELWKLVCNDLTKQQELSDIVLNLVAADKIQFQLTGEKKGGYLAKNKPIIAERTKLVKELIDKQYLDFLLS